LTFFFNKNRITATAQAVFFVFMELLNAFAKRYTNFSLWELTFFVFFGAFFFYLFKNLLGFFNQSNLHIESFPINLFFVIFWILFFLLGRKIINGIYRYFRSFFNYEFVEKHWPHQWEFQGGIRIWPQMDKALYVTDSNSGCLLKNHYWKNFEMTFQCKFPNGTDNQVIGIIFRAKNLSDYLMVQIHHDESQINPHVRMEGIWERIYGNWPVTNLTRNRLFNVNLKVIDEKVNLSINGTEVLSWFIPTNSDIRTSGTSDTKDAFVPKIDFRSIYGKVGFRAYENEGAIIKNLKIKRIKSII
jgi:hypothetical protein